MKEPSRTFESICIISFPLPSEEVVNSLLYNFLAILEPLFNEIHVITGPPPKHSNFSKKFIFHVLRNTMHGHTKYLPKLFRLIAIIRIQIEIILLIHRLPRNVRLYMSYLGATNLLLPVIYIKLTHKPLIFSELGSIAMFYKNIAKNSSFGQIVYYFSYFLEFFYFLVSDAIITESPSVNSDVLKKFKRKIFTKGIRYIDPALFYISKRYDKRNNIIGYIGRLDEAKGVLQLMEAIPSILKYDDTFSVYIVGDGPMLQQMHAYAESNHFAEKITFKGWIPHSEISMYLNELKLLILPSDSEGVPTIVLEAMACGTPILANNVGGIPDIIKNGTNGYLMESNSSASISKHVTKILSDPGINGVINNAREYIETVLTYENAIKRYKEIFNEIGHQ